ncbi:MAG: hypothetical protein DI603_08695 [Roseateles depolymerans]|uniref:Uncharacterized protein n=1 Tax=Roseateles depolymerans TaxID=76731 RepID=A0A2W5DUG9_9BURK|nr:MAG: hypothetical protein DI603_08695 [Roseateles depolymerans]
MTLAYFCSMVAGFTLMRRDAFAHGKAPMQHQMLGYCLVILAGIVQAVAVSSLMLGWVFPPAVRLRRGDGAMGPSRRDRRSGGLQLFRSPLRHVPMNVSARFTSPGDRAVAGPHA